MDKIGTIQDQSQPIGEFLDWLLNERQPHVEFGRWSDKQEVPCTRQPPAAQRQGDELLDQLAELKGTKARHNQAVGHPRTCTCKGTGYIEISTTEHFYPTHVGIQEILAEYFEIDRDEAERERMALLEWVRAQNDREAANG